MRIFVVDADYSAAQATAGLLRRSGFEVFTFDDVLMAAQYAFKNTPEIVVTQYAMPNLNGLVLAAWLKVNYPACKVVVISEDAAKVAEEAPSGLSITLVKKPAAPEVLATVIESICREGEGPLLARAR
jgi:DNA-binding NtrC family response regulator